MSNMYINKKMRYWFGSNKREIIPNNLLLKVSVASKSPWCFFITIISRKILKKFFLLKNIFYGIMFKDLILN